MEPEGSAHFAAATFDVEAPPAPPPALHAAPHVPHVAPLELGSAPSLAPASPTAHAVAWEQGRDTAPLLGEAEDLASPTLRSAGADILSGVRALTFDPLVGTLRFAGNAAASVMPQGLKDGAKKGADALKDGFITGAGAVRGGLVKTGDAIASVMPQELKDGLKTTAEAAQRGAQVAFDATKEAAGIAKDVAVEGAGVVISVLPQEIKDMAMMSREAVDKLAEASRAVERLLKDKAWRNRNDGGKKKGKKVRLCARRTGRKPSARPRACCSRRTRSRRHAARSRSGTTTACRWPTSWGERAANAPRDAAHARPLVGRTRTRAAASSRPVWSADAPSRAARALSSAPLCSSRTRIRQTTSWTRFS
jgi:hypothetical protein